MRQSITKPTPTNQGTKPKEIQTRLIERCPHCNANNMIYNGICKNCGRMLKAEEIIIKGR